MLPCRSHVITTGTPGPTSAARLPRRALRVVLAYRLHRAVLEEEDAVDGQCRLSADEEAAAEPLVRRLESRPDETPRAARRGDSVATPRRARRARRRSRSRSARGSKVRCPSSRKPASDEVVSSAVKGTKSFDSSEMPPTASAVRLDPASCSLHLIGTDVAVPDLPSAALIERSGAAGRPGDAAHGRISAAAALSRRRDGHRDPRSRGRSSPWSTRRSRTPLNLENIASQISFIGVLAVVDDVRARDRRDRPLRRVDGRRGCGRVRAVAPGRSSDWAAIPSRCSRAAGWAR